jgi:glycerophosphoryl diester phosphodiesterase
MEGFRRAIEVGADGVELDIRTTADGVPVVIHDDSVDRTTDGTGRVETLTWDELSRLRVRPILWRDLLDAAAEDPARVPRLDEVAAWANGTGSFLNIELKSVGAEEASLEIVRSGRLLERVLFSSFSPSIVSEVGRLEPAARRYLLTEHWDPAAKEAVRAGQAQGVCLHDLAATSHALVELAREGLPVVVWTVDDPERIEILLEAGVEAIITNDPAAGAAARSK